MVMRFLGATTIVRVGDTVEESRWRVAIDQERVDKASASPIRSDGPRRGSCAWYISE